MDTSFFLLWLHIISLTVYGGATLALLVLVIPAASQAADPTTRRAVLVGALRIYDPLAIAALGVLLASGMINLTDYKEAMRADFFARMGWLLMWKLLLAFLVIMMGTYLTFGLGHRIVRNLALEDPIDAVWLDSMTRRLAMGCVITLVLVAAAAWLGVAMGHPAPVA